jgi:hypothetical protein
MKHAVEMGSNAMKNTSSFINIGVGIQKLIRWGVTDTQTENDRISLLFFSK